MSHQKYDICHYAGRGLLFNIGSYRCMEGLALCPMHWLKNREDTLT